MFYKKFLAFFIFPGLVFGESLSRPDSLFFKKEESSPAVTSSLFITENKILLQSLTDFFKERPVSKKETQKLLLKKGYYQSEIVKEGKAYKIKNPFQIVFIIRGNNFWREKEIRKLIKMDENKAGGSFYNFVEEAIKSAYQNQGFLKVKIKKTEIKKKWKKWIYLNISEGPRIRIAELQVKGLLSKPSKKYADFIINNSSDLVKKGFYNKRDLEAGSDNLIKYLKNKGYLQSKIYSDRVFFKEDKAFVSIHLEEGPLTVIKDIQIKGAQALAVWEILSHMKSRVQSTLQVDRVREDLDSIERLYKSRGYLNMRIKNREDVIQYKQGERYSSLLIVIEEGPKAFISRLLIKGLKKANEKMARDLLKLKPGDVLTPLKKEKALQSLGATGLWADVSLSEKMTEGGLEVEALFKERKLRSFRGGFGLNSQRGLTTRAYSSATHRNLFGWGRALTVRGSGQVSLAQKKAFVEYEISGRYKEVFIPGHGYDGVVNLSQSRRVFNYSPGQINFVKKTQIGFFINKSESQEFKARWNIWSFENRRETCAQAVCRENPQQIGSAGFHIVWDKRDNIFDPSQGHLNSFTLEWAEPFLASSADISFIKMDFQNQWHFTLARNMALGLTARGGLIQVLKANLPVSRAFILGGRNSVRGYDGNIEGERIPRDRYAPIKTANEALKLKKGAKEENVLHSRYGLINIDFRFPLFEDFKGLFFYDLGMVYLKGKSQSLLDYGHSVGLGFRYQTFLAPVGLDIAYKLPPRKGFESYRFHFSIGW